MATLPSWPDKDPNEVLDYTVDWSARLIGTDTLASVVWSVPVGITKDSATNDTSKAVVWLSGGSEGQKYILNCSVTTTGGRVMEQSVLIKIKSR